MRTAVPAGGAAHAAISGLAPPAAGACVTGSAALWAAACTAAAGAAAAAGPTTAGPAGAAAVRAVWLVITVLGAEVRVWATAAGVGGTRTGPAPPGCSAMMRRSGS